MNCIKKLKGKPWIYARLNNLSNYVIRNCVMYVIKPFFGYQSSQVAQIHRCVRAHTQTHTHTHTHTESITLICALCRKITVIRILVGKFFLTLRICFRLVECGKFSIHKPSFALTRFVKNMQWKLLCSGCRRCRLLTSNEMWKDNNMRFGQHLEWGGRGQPQIL